MPKVVQERCRGSVCVDACLIESGVAVGGAAGCRGKLRRCRRSLAGLRSGIDVGVGSRGEPREGQDWCRGRSRSLARKECRVDWGGVRAFSVVTLELAPPASFVKYLTHFPQVPPTRTIGKIAFLISASVVKTPNTPSHSFSCR